MNAGHKLNKSFESRFKAYLTLPVALPSGVNTLIPFNAVQFDPLGEFDIVATNAFIPLQTGYYFLSGCADLSAALAGFDMDFRILLGAGTIGHKTKDTIAILPEVIGYSNIYYLQQADVLTCQVRQNSGFAETIRAGMFNTHFSGHRIG